MLKAMKQVRKYNKVKKIQINVSIRDSDLRFLASFNNGPNRVFDTIYDILEAIGEEIETLAIQEMNEYFISIENILKWNKNH